jgi:hypothetical protein
MMHPATFTAKEVDANGMSMPINKYNPPTTAFQFLIGCSGRGEAIR